jgi:serine/threonine protein kinase
MQVRNDKARKYLTEMRKKNPVTFSQKFSKADPLALRLLQRLLAFDPKDRPTPAEALADPYFKGLSKIEREPSSQQISKMEFEFERRRLTKDDIRELIYREILEYHPQLLKDYMSGSEGSNFVYPSAIGHLRQQFTYLEENSSRNGPVIPLERKHASLPRYVFSFFIYKSTVGNMLILLFFLLLLLSICEAYGRRPQANFHMFSTLLILKTFICSLLF